MKNTRALSLIYFNPITVFFFCMFFLMDVDFYDCVLHLLPDFAFVEMGQIVRPTGSDIFTRFERKEKLQSKPQTGAGATSSENGLFLFTNMKCMIHPLTIFKSWKIKEVDLIFIN